MSAWCEYGTDLRINKDWHPRGLTPWPRGQPNAPLGYIFSKFDLIVVDRIPRCPPGVNKKHFLLSKLDFVSNANLGGGRTQNAHLVWGQLERITYEEMPQNDNSLQCEFKQKKQINLIFK